MQSIKQHSPEASALYSEAWRYVDERNRDGYGGRMDYDTATEIFRAYVGSMAQRRMLEELEPIHRHIASIAAMSLVPLEVPPEEVQALIDAIHKRWAGIVQELCGPPSL